jgi:putative phage-type endonuclease
MSLTAEQQAIRSTGIGGSEIGVLAGLSRWASPIDIYERKLGLKIDEASHHLRRGVYLEPACIRWYADTTGWHVADGTTMRHPSLARVIATPDGLVYETPEAFDKGQPARVLEIKSPGRHTWSEWGEPGTDQIPGSYIAQVQWEMACANTKLADVAALIDGDLAIYTVAFDAELFAQLAEIAHQFWIQHIEARVPPPPDGSDSYAESIVRRFPGVRRDMLEATPDVEATALAYRDAKAKLEAAEAEAERLKQELQQRIGDAKGVTGSFGSITWGESKGRESLDSKALKAAHPDIAAQFVKQGAPFRTFRCNFKGA